MVLAVQIGGRLRLHATNRYLNPPLLFFLRKHYCISHLLAGRSDCAIAAFMWPRGIIISRRLKLPFLFSSNARLPVGVGGWGVGRCYWKTWPLLSKVHPPSCHLLLFATLSICQAPCRFRPSSLQLASVGLSLSPLYFFF